MSHYSAHSELMAANVVAMKNNSHDGLLKINLKSIFNLLKIIIIQYTPTPNTIISGC